MQMRAHEQLGIEFGSPFEKAMVQDNIAERQRARDAMSPDERQMADFTDQMNHGGAEEDMYELRKVYQEVASQREAKAAKSHGELAPRDEVEPQSYAQTILGELALRSQVRKFEYDAEAAKHEIVAERIEEVAQGYKHDPRYMSPIRKTVRNLSGKRQQDRAAATVLEQAQASNVTHIREYGHRSMSDHFEKMSQSEQEMMDRDLGMVRERLGSYNQHQRQTLNSLIGENSQISPFIAGIKPESMDWTDWLSSEEGGADNNQLLNVIQWHSDYIDRMNNTDEGHEATAVLKKTYVRNVEQMVADGNLPKAALTGLSKVDETPIRYLNVFTMSEKGWHGYHRKDSGEVMITDPRDVKLAAHELNHAVFDSMFDYDSIDQDLEYRWLEEAITEHLAMVMTGQSKFEDMTPDPHEQAYTIERALISAIIENSAGAVSVRDLTDVYVSKSKPPQEINEKIEQVYGFDVLKTISGLLTPDYGGVDQRSDAANNVLKAELLRAVRNLKPVQNSAT